MTRPTAMARQAPRANRADRNRIGVGRGSVFVILLLVLTFGMFTLLFWFFAATNGLVSLTETQLYIIRAIGLAGLLIGGIGLFIALAAFQRAALPIADIMEAAEHVADGDYEVQVQERGPREVRALARAFNNITSQLRQQEHRRQLLTTDLSRQIQAPLQLIQSTLEAMLNGKMARDEAHLKLVLGETQHVLRLVQDLRTLSQVQVGEVALIYAMIDMGALIRDTLTALHRPAAARGVGLRAEIPDPAPSATVDPKRLQEVLGYLIMHALGYVSPGDEITVDLTEFEDPARIQIIVSDNGRAIPPEEMARLFDHFDGERGGIGLSLALAKQLVEAHGGVITAASRVEHGTTITITVPRHPVAYG